MPRAFLSPLRHGILPLVAAGLLIAAAGAAGLNQAPRPRLEYHFLEAQASTVVMTMNKLDDEGWEVFQVVPVWEVKNGEPASLLAASYQIFARRTRKS